MNTTRRQNDLWHRDPYGIVFSGLLILLFLFFSIASLF